MKASRPSFLWDAFELGGEWLESYSEIQNLLVIVFVIFFPKKFVSSKFLYLLA